jgi:hypothetical protein
MDTERYCERTPLRTIGIGAEVDDAGGTEEDNPQLVYTCSDAKPSLHSCETTSLSALGKQE